MATTESEACRADLLKQGIQIRDFQREADERAAYLRSETALRRRMEEVAKAEAKEAGLSSPRRQNSGGDREDERTSSRCGRVSKGSSYSEGSNGGGGDEDVFEGRRASDEKAHHSRRLHRASR